MAGSVVMGDAPGERTGDPADTATLVAFGEAVSAIGAEAGDAAGAGTGAVSVGRVSLGAQAEPSAPRRMAPTAMWSPAVPRPTAALRS